MSFDNIKLQEIKMDVGGHSHVVARTCYLGDTRKVELQLDYMVYKDNNWISWLWKKFSDIKLGNEICLLSTYYNCCYRYFRNGAIYWNKEPFYSEGYKGI